MAERRDAADGEPGRLLNLTGAGLPGARRARDGGSVSTLSAPATRATTTRPPATNTSDLTIWPSSQPTAAAASRAVRVPSG